MPEQFWMVAGSGPSLYRHGTKEEADREAERLAHKSPGTAFFVMEAVTMFRKVTVERIDLREDARSAEEARRDDARAEIPF